LSIEHLALKIKHGWGWAVIFSAIFLAIGIRAQTPNTVGPRLVATDYLTNMVYDATFAAEARAQGCLLFDGSTDQYGTTSMNNRLAGSDNIGLSDFTFFARVYVPTIGLLVGEGIGNLHAGTAPSTSANSIYFWHDGGRNLLASLVGASTSDQRNSFVANFTTEFAGRWVSIAWVRSGATMSLYLNGTLRTTTENTSGSPPSDWAYDIINTGAQMAVYTANTVTWRGKIGRWGLLNFAVTADEARELAVQGTPQSMRHGKFRKKILNTLKDSTFTGTTTDWGAVGSATVGIDTVNDEMDVTANPNTAEGLRLVSTWMGLMRTSVVHRVEFTLRNLTGGSVNCNFNGSLVGNAAANGQYWFEFTPTVESGNFDFVSSGTGITFSITGVQVTDLGMAIEKTMANNGVNTAGSVGYLLNGSFETAGGGAPDVYGTWVESNTSSVWSRDATTAVSGAASAKLVVDGSNTGATINPPAATTDPQHRYKLTYWSKVDSLTGTPTLNIQDSAVNIFTNTLTTSFSQSTLTFVAHANTFSFKNGSGCAGRTVWIDDVKLEDQGAVMDIDCGVGVGNEAFDRSGNGRNMFLVADVVHDRDAPVKRGVIRGRTTTNGNEALLGAGCIPANARISVVTVNSSGSATVSLGTASAGTQIVNAASVVAGRQDLTIVARYASTRNLWVNSSAAVTLDWTITYDIVE
jgi:hypothetical protein